MPSPVSKTGGEALRVGGQLARCVCQNIREGRAEVHLGGLVGSKIDLPHLIRCVDDGLVGLCNRSQEPKDLRCAPIPCCSAEFLARHARAGAQRRRLSAS